MPGQGDRAPLSGLPDQHLGARHGVGREHGRAGSGAARSGALGEPTGTFELDGTPGDEEMHMTGIRNPHDLARLQSSAPEHWLLLTEREGPVVVAA